MELTVVSIAGKKVKALQANDAIFASEARQDLIHSVVRWQRAKKRSGTHSTLTRSKMKGGGRKPWKQKGTGRARAGSNNSPLWVGGAVIFGPQPRDYSFKLPRKVKKQALYGVLATRANDGAITIIEKFDIEKPKTKDFAAILSAVKLESTKERKLKVAFLFTEGEEPAAVSARNIPSVKCLPVNGVNVYDLLNADHLLMSEAAFSALEAKLLGEGTEEAAA